jgi:NADH-quinone oxidoreductase subunit C
MIFEEIAALLKTKQIDFQVIEENSIQIEKENLLSICTFLHETENLYFDHLASISGLDNKPKAETLELVYHLYSIPYGHSLAIHILLEREKPSVDSLTPIWKGADWHEREVFDLYGISFNNHPDLRRILLPANWEGHPMRKDYVPQEFFHGIKVKY